MARGELRWRCSRRPLGRRARLRPRQDSVPVTRPPRRGTPEAGGSFLVAFYPAYPALSTLGAAEVRLVRSNKVSLSPDLLALVVDDELARVRCHRQGRGCLYSCMYACAYVLVCYVRYVYGACAYSRPTTIYELPDQGRVKQDRPRQLPSHTSLVHTVCLVTQRNRKGTQEQLRTM